MITDLLERAARRAQLADVVVKTDETVTLTFETGRLKSSSFAQEEGTNLRVVAEGKMGFAGTTAGDPEALLKAAFASAALGEVVELPMPAPVPIASVISHYPRAAAASAAELAVLGQMVVDRLARNGCQVGAVVERSIGSVQVANSRGVDSSYDVSVVSVAAEVVRVIDDEVLIVADHLAGADLPSLVELEGLVEGILQRMEWAARSAAPPAGQLPVCFTQSGCQVLLLPLQQGCLGKSVLHGVSPLADKLGTAIFSPAFTLTDDPLLDGRSGSRPMDDEGVPSERTLVIDRGAVNAFIYDLETAGRNGSRPTGHGRRSTFGKPQPAYTNLIVSPGDRSFTQLLGLIDDGLLVDDLLGVGQGNVIGGAFSHPVALAFRVIKGEVVGRVSDAAIAGNAYELLGRIAGIGRDLKWSGSSAGPAMVIEGVAVAKR